MLLGLDPLRVLDALGTAEPRSGALGGFDPGHCPFVVRASLEIRESAEYLKDQVPGCAGGVDHGFLDRTQADPPFLPPLPGVDPAPRGSAKTVPQNGRAHV